MAYVRQDTNEYTFKRVGRTGGSPFSGIGKKSFDTLTYSFDNVSVSFDDIEGTLLYTRLTGPTAPSTVRIATALSPSFSRVSSATTTYTRA